MNIEFFGHNLKVTKAMKDYLIKKVERLKKMVTEMESARATFTINKHHKHGQISTVRVILKIKGKTVTAENEAGDFYSAIDIVQEKLEKQLRRTVSRNYS